MPLIITTPFVQPPTTWLAGGGQSFGGNAIVARSSDDGLSFAQIANLGSQLGAPWDTNPIRGLAYNGSRWVVGGRTGQLAYSDDNGVTWSNAATQPLSSEIRKMKYLNGTFFSVGNSGELATSPDGNTWTSQTSGTSRVIYDVAWNGISSGSPGALLVYAASDAPTNWAFGGDWRYSSDNGVTWNVAEDSALQRAGTGIVYNNGLWISNMTNQANSSDDYMTTLDPTATPGTIWTQIAMSADSPGPQPQKGFIVYEPNTGSYVMAYMGNAGGSTANGGFRSTVASPGAGDWSTVTIFTTATSFGWRTEDMTVGDGTILAVGNISQVPEIRRSIDGGATWGSVSQGPFTGTAPCYALTPAL